MAELWTDIIDPVELTGYAREWLEEFELANGTLARYLPNRNVADIAIEFEVGENGLVPEARYRAFDAAPEVGTEPGGGSRMVKLPAISQVIPVSEYAQLRTRNATDAVLRTHILRTMRRVVRAIADRSEKTRGVVINTGKATVDQRNFGFDDNFGRDADMSITAGSLWSTGSVDRITALLTWIQAYIDMNGRRPGAILMGDTVLAATTSGDQFRTVLVGGATRPALVEDVKSVLTSAGIPPIDLYSRSTYSGLVLPADSLFLLPAPGDPNDEDGSELGGTAWGQTLTSTLPDWGIAEEEQPGIVVGVTRNNGIPAIAEVAGDSISLPFLANANLAMKVKVL